ncbi:ABC-2 type transport system permease protein [Paenibacillus sp. V4I9]|uniref:ABC transporter permease n=1 Tax=Paenibacillus sp. V4I9 TaxID=3042308 RepID=UPI002785AC17|nr:ABC transporter permease [Paenibacillus sp. V4I9]MDQ0885604.1 ABC-2 type transport system permease protein [Paenibacillus sp. V4I9]
MDLRIGKLIAEEWKHILKDRRLFLILFFVPILYTVLFGSIYLHHKVTEMATVVIDEDQSPLSRQIIQAFEQSETFQIKKEYHSEEDVKRALSSGEAKVGLVIPSNFEAKLKHGETLPLLTLIDGSNMMISNSATKGANEVITTFSMGYSQKKLQLKQGLQNEEVMNTLSPIPFRYRIMYNSAFNYSDFMLYGLVGAILQQVLFLGIALTITREKDAGTWQRFEAWRRNPWRIAYAKTAPYFLINFFNTSVTFVIALYAFGAPMSGSLLVGLAIVVSFTFAVSGIGYLISLFSSNQLGATQTAMLIAVPSFMLSGFTWPFEAMPKVLQVLGHMLPLTYFLDGVRNVFVKGNDFSVIWHDCVSLILTGALTYFIAMLLTRFIIFSKKKSNDTAAGTRAVLPAGSNITL